MVECRQKVADTYLGSVKKCVKFGGDNKKV